MNILVLRDRWFAAAVFLCCAFVAQSPTVVAERAKLDEKQIRKAIARVLTETKTPGAVVGVYRNETTLAELAIGNASLDPPQAIKVTDCFRIGSITKSFLGIVVLQLAEENKLSLADRLSKYFPDYPQASEFTLLELGRMIAGVKDPLYSREFKRDVERQPKRRWTAEELIAATKEVPRWDTDSNGAWHYSNSAAVLLGQVVERVTGNSLQVELQHRIIDRLGISRTGYELSAVLPEPYCRGYTFAPRGKILGRGGQTIRDVTDINPSMWNAAGAMYSTVRDLKKFAQAVGRGELVSASSRAIQTAWQATPWQNHQYGFLLAEIEGMIGHDGDVPGYSSLMGFRPADQLTIIVLTNMHGWSIERMPANEIAAEILKIHDSVTARGQDG